MRKVWYHYIWIQNYFGFIYIVLTLMYILHSVITYQSFANFDFTRIRNDFVKGVLTRRTSKMFAITLSESSSWRSSNFSFNQNWKSLFTLVVCENMPYYCVLYSGNYLLLLNACIFISTYFGSIWVHFSRNIFLSLFELLWIPKNQLRILFFQIRQIENLEISNEGIRT